MNIIYILIPIGLVLLGLLILALWWASRSGQFDDLDGPAFRILMDDGEVIKPEEKKDEADDGRG